MACMEKVPGSYWAEVVGKAGGIIVEDGEEDVYLVRREAGGGAVSMARSRLRHRVIVKQCHARNCEFCAETSGITETEG